MYSVNRRLKFGFGSFAYFGGAIEYNLNWVGRYFLQGSTLLGQSFLPTVAYRVNDWLSVGGAVNVMLGFIRAKAGVRNLLQVNDGQAKYQDYTAGVGGDIGILLQPDSKTRIGITYLTPVDLNFKSTPHFRGLGPVVTALLAHRGLLNANVDLSMTVPQEVMVSVYREVTERMALLGNVNWQNWNQFGEVGIAVTFANPKSLTQNLKYTDTWQVAAGAQYKISPELLYSLGFAYDSSMVTDSTRTVTAPVGAMYRYGTGAVYQWNDHLSTGISYEFMWKENYPCRNPRARFLPRSRLSSPTHWSIFSR